MGHLRAASARDLGPQFVNNPHGMIGQDGAYSIPMGPQTLWFFGDTLIGLGMPLAFDRARADFSGLSKRDELYLAKVLHRAFVDVNEEGTEAAAATAVIMSGNGMSDKTLDVDRPFVFLIRDSSTGTLLFVGQVTDPTKF